MFLLLLILATVSLSSMNEFTWDKLRRSYIYHDLALPLKTMNDKARRSLRRGCSSRWPWTFQGWTMSSEQWTWTWGLSASLSSWTGDEVALGADVIRQMWKATDPILEKLSYEGTRRTATGGQSISRSGENNRRRHWTSLWFRSHWSNDRLWPSGLVENRYHCFLEGAPGSKISNQQQATSSTVGRTGGSMPGQTWPEHRFLNCTITIIITIMGSIWLISSLEDAMHYRAW